MKVSLMPRVVNRNCVHLNNRRRQEELNATRFFVLQVLGKTPSTSRPGLGRKEGEEGEGQTPSPALSLDTAEAAADNETKRQITPDIIKVSRICRCKFCC
jgi:hypothetical protein